jgi:sugar lactone lactonase YvrE
MTGPRVLTAELAVAAQCELAEGPVWDGDSQQLLWVDILPGRVHRLDPVAGTHSSFGVGGQIGAAGLTTARRLVLALENGFALCDADGRNLERLPGPLIDTAVVRFNDGKPDPWGGFWAGTMQRDEGQDGLGCLYRLGPDGTVSELVPGVSLSNGLDWTDDRTRFYYVDSPTGAIDLFDTDPETGALSNRRRFVDVTPDDNGIPDGLTIDADGGIWIAVWGTGELRRYDPDGELDTVVRLPVSQVSSAAFGGADLSTLYITTARENFTPAQLAAEPHAGDIFRCTPGVSGRLPFRYTGPVMSAVGG